MRRFCICVLLGILWPVLGNANNIRIDSVRYDATSVGADKGNILKMTVTVVWENSWRDDYNYDAAYVFFKFKKKESTTKVAEEWRHLFLQAAGNKIQDNFSGDYDLWLSPLSGTGTNFNAGIYIYRKNKGVFGKDSVQVEVAWDVTSQMTPYTPLTTDDIREGKVQVVGHAIEMVYVPRGAYRIGDGESKKCFRKQAFPMLAQYDIISKNYKIESSDVKGPNGPYPELAADRVNDNTNNAMSEWVGTPTDGAWWWSIDFGAGKTKKITYFGVNAASKQPSYYPKIFALLGSKNPTATTVKWDTLWKGSGSDNWVMAKDAYPIEKAIKLTKTGDYQTYKIVIDKGMNAGSPIVTTIGMTEADLSQLVDYSVLIDSPVTEKDSLRKFGATDGSVWTAGTIPATYPNGYSAFYAMKYELSQDQYARFLNKLSYKQQDNLLGGRLKDLKEGDYIFGDTGRPNRRNGIVLATKIEGMPAVFSCNLNGPVDQVRNGQNIACNYMNIQDMLAYADWACLRPLSEMEYEKMCRPFYPAIPVRKSFAWGTMKLDQPGNVTGEGTAAERAGSGNANWGGSLGYPLRVGAFARENSPGIEPCGGGFWGAMDLSGNLAEMYYNVNNLGLTLIIPETQSGAANTPAGHRTAHGDGGLTVNGLYNGAQSKQWSEDPRGIALRGGSYASEQSFLAVSDRALYTGAFQAATDRDSTVTFRLGHTAPTFPELKSWLITENEVTTEEGNRNDFFLNTPTYMVKGNKPVNPQGGLYSYIWYSQESNGTWKVMEGQTNQNLFFDKYRNDTIANSVNGLNFNFMRKVITPFADSETSSKFMVSLIANPFDAAEERFSSSNGASNTYQVKCNWDSSIPRRWGFDKPYEGLTINAQTGIISGMSTTMCNVTVTLECTLYEGIIYKKQVKENPRIYTTVGAAAAVRLLPGTYQLECWGAQGGAGGNNMQYAGGLGGYAEGEKVVTTPILLYIHVGGRGTYGNGGWSWYAGGYNGGGRLYSFGRGGAGGGATDIRTVAGAFDNGAALASRIIVAGGGGGAGYVDDGGAGGGSAGNSSTGNASGGGSQYGGGSAYNIGSVSYPATAGTLGKGGDGCHSSSYTSYGGGGGGGGFYGGGGGSYYGGGGGSGYIGGVTGSSMSKGIRSGNGQVTITITNK